MPLDLPLIRSIISARSRYDLFVIVVGRRFVFRDLTARVMPAVFVILWSTGFIGAKLGLPHAEPFTFLLTRMVIVVGVLGLVAVVARAPWPSRPALWPHIAVAGLLVHAAYLGGVFAAIGAGLSAGVTALIVGLQPLLTAAVVGPLLGERVSRRQWAGVLLGLAGLALVVWEKISFDAAHMTGLVFAVIALLGITGGTLYQKRFCAGMDLRTGAIIQYVATGLVLGLIASQTETMRIEWTGEFVFAVVWLALVLSVGAIFLLFVMIRRGAAARVAALFYLTPAVTAIFAWALFGETLGIPALVGMGLAAAGVALVGKK